MTIVVWICHLHVRACLGDGRERGRPSLGEDVQGSVVRDLVSEKRLFRAAAHSKKLHQLLLVAQGRFCDLIFDSGLAQAESKLA